ncbi:hypothetical protein V6X63_10175 [Spiribacter sp. 221]|uniref:hypothetical protein n=1 Tax=Spiribacter onubensis TaxID=3122420 RepID=UPI00349F893B
MHTLITPKAITARPARRREAQPMRLGLLALALGLALSMDAGASTESIVVNNQIYSVEYTTNEIKDLEAAITTTSWYDGGTTNPRTLSEALASASTESNAFFVYTFNNRKDGVDFYTAINTNSPDLAETVQDDVTGRFAIQTAAPVFVPEIDGTALGQGLLALSAIGLWGLGRRRDPGRLDSAPMSAPASV